MFVIYFRTASVFIILLGLSELLLFTFLCTTPKVVVVTSVFHIIMVMIT